MITLLSKRILIFYRRYILAITMLLFPCLLQIIICVLIPSSSVLDASKNVVPVKSLGNLELDINKYGDTNIPYSILSSTQESGNRFDQLLHEFYVSRDENVELEKLEEVSNYVFEERNREFSSIFSRNFLGKLIFS